MKAGLYIRYTTRSLVRGGQRTVLAMLCIAVGVMAIVALGLASQMVANSLTGNVRAANGGDVSARSDLLPFGVGDLGFFLDLRRRGLIVAYTATSQARGTVALAGGPTSPVLVEGVDPQHFPLAGRAPFVEPSGGDLRTLLAPGGRAVLARSVAADMGIHAGQSVRVVAERGRTYTLQVAGILDAGRGAFPGEADVYLSLDDEQAAAPGQPVGYGVVYMTQPDAARAKQAAEAVRARYPLATVRTVDDALQQRRDQVDLGHKLLEIVGLVALLIGGFGIMNTMQVMLARRRLEIAMLKTSGYRRGDLYALFGLEAALLGLGGGTAGALLGVALSWGVKSLMENAFQLSLVFAVDGGIVLSGVVVGLATALIFGLVPIVRGAAVRPLVVLRELPLERRAGTLLGTAGLFAVLLVLFAVLASGVLGDRRWGILTTAGAFVFLAVLGTLFSGLIWLVGRLPVPERMTARYAAGTTVAVALAAGVTLLTPAVGALFVVAALLGHTLPYLPRSWQANLKISLRNLARQRARASMTLLALLVGVFAIGSIVVLGQDLRDKIDTALATQLDFNVISLVPSRYRGEVERQFATRPGLKSHQAVATAQVIPLAVNGCPLVGLLKGAPRNGGANNLGVRGTLSYLLGLGGYDVGAGQKTGTTILRGDGRDLRAADAGSTNVLANVRLHTLGPLRLQVGDRLTLLGEDRRQRQMVTIVGFYSPTTGGIDLHFEPLLAPRRLVERIGGRGLAEIVTMKVDPALTKQAMRALTRGAPHALSLDLTDLAALVNQVLGNLILLLAALASLALFAGVIIIANAVGLAMLERRRELGILKSVGYTSTRVLVGVLIENGIVGALGGLLGMALVAAGIAVLAANFFHTTLGLPGPTTAGIVVLSTAIGLLASGLVAWGAVRVRPLEVLRYE